MKTNKVMLSIVNELPDEILDISAKELYRLFPQPTLVNIKRGKGKPLFISCLIHGLETTGFEAIQQFFKKHDWRRLNKPISIFFGNVLAAEKEVRHLENQPDYNRIWKDGPLQENKLAAAVLEQLKFLSPYACIDLHNNTARNPYYSCLTELDTKSLSLAAAFSPLALHIEKKIGSLSQSTSNLCPSVTIEAGLPKVEAGILKVSEYLEEIYAKHEIKEIKNNDSPLSLLDIVGVVRIPEGLSVGFGSSTFDICLKDEFDLNNFKILEKETVWGEVNSNGGAEILLEVFDMNDKNISENIFYRKGKEIQNKIPVIPAMFTLDSDIIQSDCLCYLIKQRDE